MKIKVTDSGINVPRQMLNDADEVEVRKEDGKVIIILLPNEGRVEDPIYGLGEHPVQCGAPDASQQHDRYLYGSAS